MDTDFLKRITLFAGLGEDQISRLAPLVARRGVPKSGVIFREGDPVEAVYFLESGLVKVYSLTADGEEQIINILRPGDFFPHLGFLEGGTYPATAEALTDSRLMGIRRTDLLDLVRHDGDFAVAMLAAMGRRIAMLQQRVRDLSHRDLRGRLARALLRLADEHGVATPAGTRLDLPLSHRELANLVGAARESVSRTLAEFRREGLVTTDPGGRLVVNRQHLLERL